MPSGGARTTTGMPAGKHAEANRGDVPAGIEIPVDIFPPLTL